MDIRSAFQKARGESGELFTILPNGKTVDTMEFATRAFVSLIPVIPIKNIEAWFLCDVEAFQRIVGTRLNSETLGFVKRCHQVESIPDPKRCYYECG
ncbi:MAG: hypothetical protein APF81_25390 [Desulfosporosinus sp. BRH_c37]|nr:MAG: hypothetical protein APF81_25390 [Desulfosporosinus sp. BRH_c37]